MVSPYPHLFSEWQLGTLTLKNRIVLSAMTTGFGYEDGAPTQDLLDYFAARSHGVALATVAFGAVAPEGRVEKAIPWMWRPDAAEALAPLAEAIDAAGAVPSLQLGHGGRQVSPRVIGTTPVGPSAIKPERHVDEPPHELSLDEIVEIVAAFGRSAAIAAEAGFGAVEVHGAHGYLIQQFLSTASNQRDDGYGEDGARFGVEVIEAIRHSAPELAIVVRINGSDLFDGGLTVDEGTEAARRFAAAGADAVMVSAGVYGSVPYTIPLLDDPEGAFLDLAAAIKTEVDVPVIGVGRITMPETAEAALTSGDVDAVAIGRALLADPDWVAKAAEGRVADIRPCIATVQGCAGMLQYGEPISCAVNPEVGREARPLPHPTAQTDVTVVGGGAAGMEAARRAAELGHAVTLWERSEALGGQLRWAAATPPLAHLGRLIAWYERQLVRLGVAVRLGEEAPAGGGEHRIVATGAVTEVPALDGFAALPTWTFDGLFDGEASTTGSAEPEGKVVVVGAGHRTLATALWLADRGCEATVLADGPLGRDTSGLARHALLARCDRAGVARVPGRLVAAAAGRVELAEGDPVECDALVLVEPLRSLHPASLTGIRVGDAVAPGGIAEAIASGRQAAEGLT